LEERVASIFRVEEHAKQKTSIKAYAWYMFFYCDFLLGVFFDPEDRGNMFL
jgi:hypothetical protein